MNISKQLLDRSMTFSVIKDEKLSMSTQRTKGMQFLPSIQALALTYKKDNRQMDGNDILDILENLTIDYNKKLVEKGEILDKTELKNKNQIDVRKLMDISNTAGVEMPNTDMYKMNETRDAFMKEVGWTSIVPCFEEGVIRINNKRYIHYKMTNIDVAEKSYDIYLHDYTYQRGEYLSGCYGIGHAAFTYDESTDQFGIELNTKGEDVILMDELYRLIDPKDLNWSKKDLDLWATLQLSYADCVATMFKEKYDTDSLYELFKVFAFTILLINTQLYLHKPSRPVKTNQTKTVKKIADEHPIIPEKQIRKIGVISIESDKIPRLPTEQSVIKYKVAQWLTRGHIRNLKSGKQIYIKETIHKRHALSVDSNITPQQIIKFTK